MNRKIFLPERDGTKSHPFFRHIAFTYKVTYSVSDNRTRTIEYQSPHEVILNLKSFNPDDTIVYVNKDNGRGVFTITVDKFNHMLAESMMESSPENLETLYGWLLLTNNYSKSISDKGRLRHYDEILHHNLSMIKGGVDSYLAYEQRKVVLYLKHRRTSIHHLTTVLRNHQDENDIKFYHINVPLTVCKQPLLAEVINLYLPKNRFRIYTYNPNSDEDNIIPTDISREIICTINQLIN